MSNNPQKFGELAPSAYPGERLGLAESGPYSVARIGRRLAALAVDWALALLIARLFPVEPQFVALVNLAVFAVMQVAFIATMGGSVGHLLFRMRVASLTGGWIGIWRPLVRTALLCLVVPALVWDSDQRAFHDKIPGSVLIKI
ncbi:RDD family protein [Canibacter oris]|uniref:Putative RDD family membrane protein YckC n=1 Tax=Canibacter oris TaxID=1365628 RepID=A0A840DIH3_9MICO|nr:RDD family protein [Canibacter oris]MBB4071523.1 putative RDD family membrane protein YckC [Canibacter oris]